MENKFKDTESENAHCRICKGKLFQWEDDNSICSDCLFNIIQDTKTEFKAHKLFEERD